MFPVQLDKQPAQGKLYLDPTHSDTSMFTARLNYIAAFIVC